MQCSWKQRLRLWPELVSRTDAEELGEDRPPCRNHLRARHQNQIIGQNKGIHPQF